MKHEFPERIIPPLPDKNRMEYLGRFTPDFIKRRQLGLKRFLVRIDGNPNLTNCELFGNFLKMPIVGMCGEKKDISDLINNKRCDSEMSIGDMASPSLSTTTSSLGSSYLKPVIDSLSDVTLAIFSRSPKNIPEKFLKLKKDVKMVRNHLSHLERLFNNRVMEHQPAIIEGMKEIAGNFDELSSSIDLSISSNNNNINSIGNNDENISPSFVKSMLSRVSATMTQCSHLLDKSLDDQEVNLLAVLLEYTQYCDSALEIIEMRDRRQVEVEELTKLIEGYQKEFEELEGKQKEPDVFDSKTENLNESSSNSASPSVPSSTNSDFSVSSPKGFFDYLSTKWDSWKGVDPITLRKNRLQKCQNRLIQTQAALKASSALYCRGDEALSEEISTFMGLMKRELAREFENHGKSQVKYHETNLVYWKDFLAWLDNPPKHL